MPSLDSGGGAALSQARATLRTLEGRGGFPDPGAIRVGVEVAIGAVPARVEVAVENGSPQ